jgi:hypothetical protein
MSHAEESHAAGTRDDLLRRYTEILDGIFESSGDAINDDQKCIVQFLQTSLELVSRLQLSCTRLQPAHENRFDTHSDVVGASCSTPIDAVTPQNSPARTEKTADLDPFETMKQIAAKPMMSSMSSRDTSSLTQHLTSRITSSSKYELDDTILKTAIHKTLERLLFGDGLEELQNMKNIDDVVNMIKTKYDSIYRHNDRMNRLARQAQYGGV